MFKDTKHPWTNDQILELIKLENEGNLDASIYLAVAKQERLTAMSKEETGFISKILSPLKGIRSTEESVHDAVNLLKTEVFMTDEKDFVEQITKVPPCPITTPMPDVKPAKE